MTLDSYHGINNALQNLLHDVLYQGNEVETRGLKSKELHPCVF